MKTEDGKRMWKVMWADYDDDDEPYESSWEPTRNVTSDLIAAYLADQKTGVQRQISVNVQPLDTLVQNAIALSMQHGAEDAFGHKRITPAPAMALRGLAEYYLASVARRFNLERGEQVNCPGEYTTEVELKVPKQIGEFCDFGTHLGEHRATKSLVFRGLRKTNCDGLVIGYIKLRYTNNKRTPGLVTFEVEHHSAYLNGATGELVAPHQVDGFLKYDTNLTALRVYTRAILPSFHQLATAGWTGLRATQATLDTPIGISVSQ